MSIPLFNADNPKRYPPRSSPIIPGILHRPKLTTLWGAPGSGKSHVALDLACIIAQVADVVYVAAEAVDEFLPRLDAWRAHYGKPLSRLWIWGEPVMMLDAKSCAAFYEAVKTIGPVALFIDPLAECFVGGDENSTQDMTTAIRNINILRVSLQAGICLLHHSGWNDSHERGSSVLRAATRLNLSVRMQNETVVVKAHKRNAGRLLAERYFKIIETDSDEHTVLIPSTREMHPITGDLPKRQREVLTALAMPIFRDGVHAPELADFLELSRSTLHKVGNALIERGLALKQSRSGLISITDLGDTIAGDLREWIPSGQAPSDLSSNLNWISCLPTLNPPPIHPLSTDNPLSTISGPSVSTFVSTHPSLEGGQVDSGRVIGVDGEKGKVN